jgi:hypothetical protein
VNGTARTALYDAVSADLALEKGMLSVVQDDVLRF